MMMKRKRLAGRETRTIIMMRSDSPEVARKRKRARAGEKLL